MGFPLQPTLGNNFFVCIITQCLTELKPGQVRFQDFLSTVIGKK